MLIPIGDDDRNLTGPAYVTTALIVVNLFVYFFLQGAGGNEVFTYGWSAVPYEITSGQDLERPVRIMVSDTPVTIPQAPGPSFIYLTLISSIFMHGGIMHLFGNMLYLWIFGDNVEQRFGWKVFLGFYLVSGLVATLAQIMIDPESVIPSLGASGAISGVLGAYMVLFPRNRVYALFIVRVIAVPAVIAIGIWIAFQLMSGWGSLTSVSTGGGVAYGAHIGGFFAGLVMALILRSMIRKEPAHVYSSIADRDGSRRYW